jgi:hypothetical protein
MPGGYAGGDVQKAVEYRRQMSRMLQFGPGAQKKGLYR